MNASFDVVIVGGGAAGLFCAFEAGRRGRKVLVIERNSQLGRKIIISGGGRCNFTNIHTSPENFVSRNPHFCKSALARYTPENFVGLVKKHKIDFYEKKLGQLFCRESSRQIVDMLVAECERAKVNIRTGCSVLNVERHDKFHLDTTIGKVSCTNMVIATGGLSFPKVGATDFGYRIAKQFGIKIEPTRPSLVPLVLESTEPNTTLAGISVDATVTTDKARFRENILFTHRGLSGPAILQISNYWKKSQTVAIDLMPDTEFDELLRKNLTSSQALTRVLGTVIPARLAESIPPPAVGKTPLKEISKQRLAEVEARLKEWTVRFRDTEGYDKAEVTAGGVSTDELSSQTMESKKIPGLFFIGEVVDVTGWLGGYNFQWAWASAHAAGQAV